MNEQTDTILSVTLHLAVIICLIILVIGLLMDLPPLVALLRSLAALGLFILLGGPFAWLCRVPAPVETADNSGLAPTEQQS